MTELYYFNHTVKTTIHLTQENLLFVDASKSMGASGQIGQSARINELLERYRKIFYDYQPSLKRIFSHEDLLQLADGWMPDGKSGSWIKDWADNKIETAKELGKNVDEFIVSETLISKISQLSVAEISVLEDMVAMHLSDIERIELSERDYKIIRSKLKAKLADDPGELSAYLTGQIKGLMKRYLGENFGEQEVHDRLMVEKSERGKGYQDGFNLINLPV